MAESVGNSQTRKGTNQFMRQGHTSGTYGNNPSIEAKGQAGQPAKELKP